MAGWIFETAPAQALPVANREDMFPVHRVYCIGRNYAEHAAEMGADTREEPFYFQKNPSNLDPSGEFPYPAQTSEVHHEVELMVALRSGGMNIEPDDALDHVWGYGIAIDMTRRDVQAAAKKAGRPWEAAKAFERSAPVGPIYAASEIGHPSSGRIELRVNGEVRQAGDLSDMIWSVAEIIAHLSRWVSLRQGDVILTGTPAGVGPVQVGETLTAGIAPFSAPLTVRVTK